MQMSGSMCKYRLVLEKIVKSCYIVFSLDGNYLPSELWSWYFI